MMEWLAREKVAGIRKFFSLELRADKVRSKIVEPSCTGALPVQIFPGLNVCKMLSLFFSL